MDNFLVFAHKSAELGPAPTPPLQRIVWRPSLLNWQPPGPQGLRFLIWWVCHWLRVFGNRDYAVIAFSDRGEIVHRSCIFPKYFRFPFMSPHDLQIGDTWTAPSHRGQGLAVWGVLEAVALSSQTGRVFWYLTERSNTASIRVVRKARFELYGPAARTAPFGLRLFGSFEAVPRFGSPES